LSPYDLDDFDLYEDQFNPLTTDRQSRRKRKPKANHVPKAVRAAIPDETPTDAGGWETTYTPSDFEAVWLIDSVRPFRDQSLIDDLLGRVKGGKEASVYRCRTHPEFAAREQLERVAAKVYRPRMHRSLSNDAMYRQGREVLSERGHAIKKSDGRVMRALGKKTSFGAQVAHTSWLMYEFKTLKALRLAGASVPAPHGVSENAILMTYYGDDSVPAPALNDVALERDEAHALFEDVLHNLDILLQTGFIHGDLSAYNLLYWEGAVILIDFPQVVQADSNPYAQEILARDIMRVCEYFQAQGVRCDAERVGARLWKRFFAKDARSLQADFSRLEVPPDERK
jgi:RIO kinase 1